MTKRGVGGGHFQAPLRPPSFHNPAILTGPGPVTRRKLICRLGSQPNGNSKLGMDPEVNLWVFGTPKT
jgi:hypothetical protein